VGGAKLDVLPARPNHLAVGKQVLDDAAASDKGSVAAAQVLDHAPLPGALDLGVLARHLNVVKLDDIVRVAADGNVALNGYNLALHVARQHYQTIRLHLLHLPPAGANTVRPRP